MATNFRDGHKYIGAFKGNNFLSHTVCQGISDPFYIVSYNIKWVTTSWTHST